jgi:hypothetical protein
MVAAAAVSMCGLGCSGPGGRVEPLDVRGCPSGDDVVHATDVIGTPPPSGYVIDPGRKQVLEGIAEQFKPTLGDSWRGYDAKVLVRKGRRNGAAVIVINSDDKTVSRGADLARGFEKGAEQRGVSAEKIVIGGREGRMVPTADGGYIAMAPAGQCAVVLLVGDEAPLLRDAASVIPKA